MSLRQIIQRSQNWALSSLILYFLVTAIFTTTMNVLYVLNVKNLTGTKLFIVQICFAIFKTCFQWMPELIKNHIVYKVACCQPYKDVWRKIASVDNRIVLNLFSIMIAPCIATSIANSNCYYYFFFSAAEVHSSYHSSSTDSFAFENQIKLHKDYYAPFYFGPRVTTVYTTFTPSYSYSYQCAFPF